MRVSEWRRKTAIAVLLMAGAIGVASAQQQESPESRLRSALRQTTVQLREQEDQNATLQAKQAQADRDRLAIQQKLDADEKELAGLRRQVQTGLAASQQAADAATKNLGQWQTAYNDAANVARTRDGDAKRADAELVKLREQLRQEQEKNQQLYKLGQELLDLYDKKDFGSLLTASDPVTKIKRVEFENIMQDYQDKLRANQVAQPAP
jgi:hypothetical protein